jgi:hypothetical protein
MICGLSSELLLTPESEQYVLFNNTSKCENNLISDCYTHPVYINMYELLITNLKIGSIHMKKDQKKAIF